MYDEEVRRRALGLLRGGLTLSQASRTLLVGVPWRQSNWKTLSVSRRESVTRLDQLIGLKA